MWNLWNKNIEVILKILYFFPICLLTEFIAWLLNAGFMTGSTGFTGITGLSRVGGQPKQNGNLNGCCNSIGRSIIKHFVPVQCDRVLQLISKNNNDKIYTKKKRFLRA